MSFRSYTNDKNWIGYFRFIFSLFFCLLIFFNSIVPNFDFLATAYFCNTLHTTYYTTHSIYTHSRHHATSKNNKNNTPTDHTCYPKYIFHQFIVSSTSSLLILQHISYPSFSLSRYHPTVSHSVSQSVHDQPAHLIPTCNRSIGRLLPDGWFNIKVSITTINYR